MVAKIINVLLICEQPLIYTVISTLFAQTNDLKLVHVTNIKMMQKNIEIDIVLLDTQTCCDDVWTTVSKLQKYYNHSKLVLLAHSNTDCCTQHLLQTGVSACILHEEITNSVLYILRAVVAGGTLFSGLVVENLIVNETVSQKVRKYYNLTDIEWNILMLICDGFSNSGIAQKLCLAEQTIKNKSSQIYSKMGVMNRMQAVKQIQVRLNCTK